MTQRTEKYIKGGLLVAFIAFFAYATINDYSLSLAFANPGNILGEIMEDITVIPFSYAILLSGAIALGTCKKGKSFKEIINLILCTLYYLVSVGFSSIMLYGYLPVYALAIHLVAVILITVFAFRIKEEDKKNWQKLALVIGLVLVISMTTVEGLKMIWGRVRPRSIGGNAELFTPWYSINGDKFLSFVSSKEELKSFPSGHSQWGAMALSFSLLPRVSKRFKGKDFLFLMICLTWSFLVMVARASVGAHFPTDTMMGFAFTAIPFFVLKRLIFGKAE